MLFPLHTRFLRLILLLFTTSMLQNRSTFWLQTKENPKCPVRNFLRNVFFLSSRRIFLRFGGRETEARSGENERRYGTKRGERKGERKKETEKEYNEQSGRGEGGEGRGPDERGQREVAALPGTLINLDPISSGLFLPVPTTQSARVIPCASTNQRARNTTACEQARTHARTRIYRVF